MCNFHDPRIIRLRRSLGMEGFGIYQALMICLSDDGHPLPYLPDEFAYEFRVDAEKVKAVICDFDLFVVEDNLFYHRDLGIPTKRKSMSATERARHAANTRWSKASDPPPADDNQLSLFATDPAPEPTPEPTPPPPPAPKPKAKPKPPADPAHNECKQIFLYEYSAVYGEDYYWQAKDASALKQTLSKIRYKMAESERGDPSAVAVNFKAFIHAVMGMPDQFVHDNMSMSLVNSKFNEIYTKLKNGRQSVNRNQESSRIASNDIFRAIAKEYDT